MQSQSLLPPPDRPRRRVAAAVAASRHVSLLLSRGDPRIEHRTSRGGLRLMDNDGAGRQLGDVQLASPPPLIGGLVGDAGLSGGLAQLHTGRIPDNYPKRIKDYF